MPTDSDLAWRTCIDSNKPAASSYQYCEINMENKVNKDQCKYDFCKLCCVTSSQQSHVKLSSISINKCYKECGIKFMDKEDDEILPK